CDAFDLPAGAQSLVVKSNPIGPAAATLLAGVLKLSQTLTTLDLSSSGICQVTDYVDATKVSGESKEVGAEVVYQGRELIVSEAKDFTEKREVTVETTVEVKDVVVSKLRLADVTGVLAIAKGLTASRSLITVNLLGNSIPLVAAQQLVAVFKQHQTLQTLCGFQPGQSEADLSGSELRPADGILIAADLRFNRSLLNLRLGGNELADEGAAALAEALKCNKMLATLDLSGNELGPNGAAAFARALAVNSTLSYLDVSSNSITDSGMRNIGASLLSSSASKLGALKCDAFDLPAGAQSLVVKSNPIGPAAATLLAGVLKLSQTLTTLDLSSSGICQVTDYVDATK
ncbi:hypothetical protein EMIHUDRAFT_259973, partial [Emiliania huxleyi CCMP1516]|uniref:Uncharacterized protein n=2 Tax=Emiliania huxleyi TaxID=2903 RepID=A0A0D3KYV7_EMIH1